MTGLQFHLSERPVVMFFTAGGIPGIVLPELEMLKLSGLEFEIKAFPYGEDPAGWPTVFTAAGKMLRLEGKRIGMEPRSMRLLEFCHVKAIAQELECQDAGNIVGTLRLHKDPDEISTIRKAVKIAQDALEATVVQIKAGMTEKEVAAELVMQLLRHGSDPELPFFPIVSSGPNGANPHATPSERKLQEGDLLVVDWGAAVDGYISDLTRTFAVGDGEEEFMKIHQIVQEANAAGRAAGKPGLPCSAVDRAAREVIEKSGYGEYFYPPDRPWDRTGGPRRAVYARGQLRNPGAGYGLHCRAGHLSPRAERCQDRG